MEAISSATKTLTPLRDVPQSVTVVTQELIRDQLMMSIGDVVRYVPGVTAHQGENNRDQIIIRGNSSSADFFVNGVRDDVQYYRDLYNLERVEALKGPERDDLRPRRRRRRDQPRDQGGGLQPAARSVAAGRDRTATSASPPISTSRSATRSRSASTACTRTRTASATASSLERYGINPTLTLLPSDRHQDHARLRIPARQPRRRSRHHVVSGPAR